MERLVDPFLARSLYIFKLCLGNGVSCSAIAGVLSLIFLIFRHVDVKFINKYDFKPLNK